MSAVVYSSFVWVIKFLIWPRSSIFLQFFQLVLFIWLMWSILSYVFVVQPPFKHLILHQHSSSPFPKSISLYCHIKFFLRDSLIIEHLLKAYCLCAVLLLMWGTDMRASSLRAGGGELYRRWDGLIWHGCRYAGGVAARQGVVKASFM